MDDMNLFIVNLTMFCIGSLRTFFVVFVIWKSVVADDCPADRQEANHYEAKLHNDLTKCSYLSDVRPVKDHKSSINVKVRFAIKYLSFDSLEETFTVHSWVALTWKDEFLSWDPQNYGNIDETQMESHEIWTPRLALFNADASYYQSDSLYTTCSVSHLGIVTCVPHLVHSGICRTKLQRWPYDVQNCTLYFGSWMNTGEQVNFTFYNKNPVNLEDYQNGPGWKLLGVVNKRLPGKYSCCPNRTYPMLKYEFKLEREAAGPAAVVVIPSIVIVILTIGSLLLDIKDNIRLLMICFSLLSHFIFLTEIGYDIPKHSADTPLILLFLRDSMIMTLFSILTTLFLMSLRRRVLPAPTWIVSVNRLISNGPGKYVVFTEFDPSEISDGKILTEGADSNTSEERTRVTHDWIQFANLINSFVFIISIFIYVVIVFLYIPFGESV